MSSDLNHSQFSELGNGILEHTEVNLSQCYQCGKCSAGCPLADEMDYPPSMLMRMLQTGNPDLEDKVLRSLTIWICLTCEMCFSRCPMNIDIPEMMDYLRGRSLNEKKVTPKAKKIIAFHKSFLDSIKYTGRLYEIGLFVDYKSRTLRILDDMALAPKMIKRGKLHLFPELISGRSEIASVFNKSNKKNKNIK